MKSPKLYARRHPKELEPHYSRHVRAMTEEGLHSKADIAAELAYRDQRIEELEARAEARQKTPLGKTKHAYPTSPDQRCAACGRRADDHINVKHPFSVPVVPEGRTHSDGHYGGCVVVDGEKWWSEETLCATEDRARLAAQDAAQTHAHTVAELKTERLTHEVTIRELQRHKRALKALRIRSLKKDIEHVEASLKKWKWELEISEGLGEDNKIPHARTSAPFGCYNTGWQQFSEVNHERPQALRAGAERQHG